ncbi:MAG: copper resistance protein B [Deltaproteobacteria bacterium]|nr:copper resistance protein B [Deltaproteobacteria bacterium]
MGISTAKGDAGSTSLYRGGRVPKHHLIIEANGAIDEAISHIGLARASAMERRIRRIPAGMTLDEVFEFADLPPPDFPVPIHDDKLYAFTLVDQLEYRVATDDATAGHLAWEIQGWIGGDFNRFWWKNEGEAAFEGTDEGETETDLLYSRLITPFWYAQVGVQYANEWNRDDYDDRWSGVIALQGLAPYKFELDNSLYISEDGDVTLGIETEYDLYITQRLVLQP